MLKVDRLLQLEQGWVYCSCTRAESGLIRIFFLYWQRTLLWTLCTLHFFNDEHEQLCSGPLGLLQYILLGSFFYQSALDEFVYLRVFIYGMGCKVIKSESISYAWLTVPSNWILSLVEGRFFWRPSIFS